MHVHAERRLCAADAAGFVILQRLVGGLEHAVRRHAEAVVERLLERLHALIERLEVDTRHVRPEPQRASDCGRDRRKVGGALGHRIRDQAAKPHVVAADRHQHDVDLALRCAGAHQVLLIRCGVTEVLPAENIGSV